MTELDAVNQMLENINESPVDTLEDVEFTLASVALKVLRRVSNKVQAKGWAFNSEIRYVIQPDSEGHVVLPANTLKVDPSTASRDYVQRGNRLYDRVGHTFVVSEPVELDLVVELAFEDLPASVQHYLAIKAARDFARTQVGSQSAQALSELDEQEAFIEVQALESESADVNLIYGERSRLFNVDDPFTQIP